MTDQMYSQTTSIVASDVSADEYMAAYAETYHEWVAGEVLKMAPVSDKHDSLTSYLRHLLSAYLALRPIGTVRSAPFVMRLDALQTRREPDLQVILNENLGELTATAMVGAADICIEVVSPSNEATDYGTKFSEYERGGVREYWLIDPLRDECRFHRLNNAGKYKQIIPQADVYRTPLLPDFALSVSTLWRDTLPNFYEIGDIVKQMMKED